MTTTMSFDADEFVQHIDRVCSPDFCRWVRERLAVPVHQDIGSAYQALVAALDEGEWLTADTNKLITLEIMEKVSRLEPDREVRTISTLLAL